MSVRDWDAAIREAQGEPVQFVLGGVTFDVPVPIPAYVFLSFADREASGAQLTAAFRDLVRDMVERSQRDAFETAVRDSRIGGQQLVDLAKEVIEEASARPTPRRSDSPPSPSANGVSSSSGRSARPGAARRPRTRSA